MQLSTTQTYFLTGTDTDVGKTVIGCGLLTAWAQQGLSTIGHKPISAGCESHTDSAGNVSLYNSDALALQSAATLDVPYAEVNPIAYREAIAPHIAADLTHTQIDLSMLDYNLQTLQQYAADVLLVEGAGGWALPINSQQTLDTWVLAHKMPVIMVVAMRLGCLNHALLTARQIVQNGGQLVGWVANAFCDQPFESENIATLQTMLDVPCLGVVPKLTSTTVPEQAAEVAACLDISVLSPAPK